MDISSYRKRVLSSHAAWIKNNIDIVDVHRIHHKLKNSNPFINYGYEDINQYLNITALEDFKPEEINYLFIDDLEFDGDLRIFEDLTGVQDMTLRGTNFSKKIEDLTPLNQLNNLRSLNLENNMIEDLSPLLSLKNLESLIISENPIKNLQNFALFRGLLYLKYIDLKEELVCEILRENPDCIIEYCNRELGDCYTSFNVKNHPVRLNSYFVDDMPYKVSELTFMGVKNIPLTDEEILSQNFISKQISNDMISYEVHGNTFYFWNKSEEETE